MSSGLKDFIIGGSLIALSFFVPGGGMLASYISATLFTYGSSRVISGIRRAFIAETAEALRANVLNPQSSIPIVYGEARVGLRVVDSRNVDSGDISTPTADPDAIFSGAKDKEIHVRVGALCLSGEGGHGIDSISKVRFYGDPTSAINPVTDSDTWIESGVQEPYQKPTSDNDGDEVHTCKYLIGLGEDGQTRPTDLEDALGWAATYKGVGIAYIALALRYNPNIYRGGFPNVDVLVKGALIYDPRDPTGGPSSDGYAWSDNPALVLLDYLTSKRYGAGYFYPGRDGGDTSLTQIDEQTFIDAANHCDEVVTVGGAPAQKRFRFNGAVNTSESIEANLEEMKACCRGELVWQGRKVRLIIRKAQSPVSFELTEDNIIGEWKIRRKGNVPNSIEGTFIDDRNDNFAANSIVWPITGDTTFLDADNGIENKAEVQLRYTTDYYQALQTIMVMLREAREDALVALTATQDALQLETGDVVRLTHTTPGWTQKEFWVAGMALRPDGNIRLALMEYDASAYSLDALDARATVPGTNLPNPFYIEAPTGISLTSDSSTALDTQDGQRIPQILVTWTAPTNPFLHHYEIRHKKTVDSAWQTIIQDKDDTSVLIIPVSDGESYDVRVVAVNVLGRRSALGATGANATIVAGTSPGTDVRIALDDFREVARSDSSVTYEWNPGTDVATIWVYENLVQQPTAADPWPNSGDVTNLTSIVDATVTTQITLSIPPPGYARYVQLEPMSADGVEGPPRRLIVLPLSDEPDRIISRSVRVIDEDGSVKIRIEANALAGSYRYAYAVGTDPSWSSDAAVEAGTIRTISSVDSFTLPAGTVGLGERIRIRFAGYLNADGTGTDGATDHSLIVNAEDDRTKFRVPRLEIVSHTEDGVNGTFTVKVVDPDGLVDDLYVATKEGANATSAFALKAASPAHDSQHNHTVPLMEKHQSFIIFELRYTLGGEAGRDTLPSHGFDKGQIAGGSFHPVIDEDAQTATGWAVGESDTTGWKVVAQANSAVLEATVDAAGTISGRTLTPASIGTLVSGLTLGDVVHFGWKAIGPGGNGPFGQTNIPFLKIAPILKRTTEEEDLGSNIGRFGVTVDDPAAQADGLEYRTKVGQADWGAWTDAVGGGAPPNHNTEYLQTIGLVENQLAWIQFRMTYTLRGIVQTVEVISPGFDPGRIPKVQNISSSFDAVGNFTVAVNCDVDTDQFWIYVNTTGFITNRTTIKTGTNIAASQGVASFGPYTAGDDVYIHVVAKNDTTNQENTSIAQHQDKFTEVAGGEQGNYARGTLRWAQKDAETWQVEGDIEIGPDTTELDIDYTLPSDGVTLANADNYTGLSGGGIVAIVVQVSSVAVGWGRNDYAPQIHITPKAGIVNGDTKIYQLKSPGTAAEGSVRVVDQAGTSVLSSEIVARLNYGVEMTVQSGKANFQAKPGDWITISTSDPSGNPNNTAEPALWLKVAP